MAGMFDAAVDEIAAGEDKAARAAAPGSTLEPPAPTVAPAQNPGDVLPGLPADLATPAPAPMLPGPAQDLAPTVAPTVQAAPAARGMFDAAVEEIATEDTSRLSSALETARTQDPVRYTEAARIAERDGLPLEFVTQNLDDLKTRATANDMRKSLEASPRLKQWFLTGDNANTVKLDDLHKLSGLGWLMEATGAQWSDGWDQRQSADIRYRQIFGRATPEEIARADVADRAEKRDYGSTGFFQGAIPALAGQLPNMAGGLLAGIQAAPYAATLGTAVGASVGSLAGGIGTVPGAVAGFGSGVATGMIQGRATDSFKQEAGGAYSEFLQIKGDNGERVDPEVAKGAALIAGAANAALETIGEAALERLVPGLDKYGVGALLRNGSREVLKEAIKRPSIAAVLKSFGGNVARGGATEIGTEVLQEAVTIMSRIATEKNSAGEFQPMEAAEISSRLVETAEQTAQAMLILTPALGSTRLGRDLTVWKRSEDMRAIYQGANEAAATTELRTRAPEKYLDAVKSFLGDGKASDTVYVSTDKLTELFQSMDLSPADLDARIDGFSARYAEALATGNDTHIDMAAFQTHIAGTPLGEALIEHQRWHPELATVAEARDALAEARSAQDSMLEEALNAAKADAAKAAPRKQVEDSVYAMLVNIGESPSTARAQAVLQGAFFGTMGERAGIDPVQLFNDQGLDIRRAMPDGLDYRKTDELDFALDAIRKGDAERAGKLRRKGQGASLGSFLKSRGGLRETDAFAGELRARDLKGGLRAKEGAGLDLDSASLAAAEAGYFPNAVNDDGTINREGLVEALLSAVDEETAGRPLFTLRPDEVQIDTRLARVEALAEEMAALGLDTASMTNDEIRTELMKASSPNATEGALFQEAKPRPAWMEEILSKSHKRDAVAKRAAEAGGTVRLKNPDGRVAAAGPDMSAPGGFRLTRFDSEGPVGHTEHASLEEAVREGMRNGYQPAAEFFQSTDLAGPQADKRGSIQFQGERTVINLFQAANLSTFLHESAHLFLEVSKQVAERPVEPGANDVIRDDWRTVLAYIGAKEGEAIPREAHEKFAKAFETYLSEGRAPSDELRGVFERFKSWMLRVYRGVQRAVGLPAISPEIRDVFDRMLATDQEIAEVQSDRAVRPMFADAAAAGVTDVQWAKMVKAAEAATDAAKGTLMARMMGERAREQTAEWKAQKEAIRAEVVDDLSQRPVYQVQHYIRTGEILNSTETVPPDIGERRLDRAWLVNHFGKDVLSRLPKQSGRLVYVEKGGISPDEMADWFGFTSGEHMIGEMLSAVPYQRAVVARTDELMRERNGDLLSNQAAVAEAAATAFHNDVRAPFLELELQALASKAKIKAGKVLPQKVARQMARDLIRGKKASEAGRVAVFARARDKAARAAETAMLREDWTAAAEAKRQQIFNHYLTLEAQSARDEAEAIRRYLDKFSDRKRPGGVDPDYLDQIEGILERFEFKRATSLPAIERRKTLAAFVAEAEARGDALLIPQDLLDKAALTSYKDMTMEDLDALRDVVKNVEHLGRLKNRLLEKGRLVSFERTRDELVAQARKTPTKKAQKYRNPTGWERFANGVAGVDAYLLKMEQVFQWLDFGDASGPFSRIVFGKFVEAQNRKSEMQLAVSAKLKTILDGLDAGYLNERKAVPARPELSFLRSELYAIALNQGTESNRAKVLKGETSATNSFRSEDEMNSALSLLTKEDWDRVQSMWDVLEGFWPETAALERRLTGVEPPRLERRKVATAFGEYAGGYYPMVYDPAQAFDVQQRSDKELDAQFDNTTFSRPAVAHGFTKARVENYARPILLDLRALTGHIDKAIQNITHREPVRDALKLITDPTLQASLIETMGRPVYQEMYKWLDRIAKDRGEPPANATVARVLSGARANISLYAMGFRLTTALSQFAGWSNSLEKVRPGFLASGLYEMTFRPRETWDLISSKSGEMRDRTNNLDRDVRSALARLEGKTGAVDAFKRHAFFFTAMADRMVAGPTWLGAYNQHLATYPTDEAGAVRSGDAAVRLTQGAGAAKDLSSIMGNKNEALQVYTMFYSYFNLYYNRLRTLGRDTRVMLRDGDYEDIPHLLARSLALVILPAVMADALVGKWKDEDETVAWWAFRKASLYPLMSVPIARDIAGSLDSGLAYQMSPLARFGELATKLAQDANKVAQGEQVEGRMVAKRAAELAGYTFGLPLGQTVGTASNVWQGLEQNDFKTRDLLFGRRAFGDTRDQ